MPVLGNITIARKMYLLLCLFALDLIGLAVFSYWTIRTVQVNGPLYHNIVTAKDLVADVLPPPKYLVESYLVVLLMMDARGPENLTAYIDKSRGLREEYTTRQEFWLKELPQGQLKRLLCETSHRPAMEFFEIRDNQFIPALRAGRLEQARALAQGPLRNKYEEHRVQIDRVVELATAAGTAEESRAAAIMRRRAIGMLLMAVIPLLVSIALGVGTVKHIVHGLRRMTRTADLLSVGDVHAAEHVLRTGADAPVPEAR